MTVPNNAANIDRVPQSVHAGREPRLDGLTEAEAADRLQRIGRNDGFERGQRSMVLRFLARFANPLIMILLIASSLAAATGDKASFTIVVVIILLSVVLDFVQEVRADTAVEALRRSVAVRATVVRDGMSRDIEVDSIVPGDVVVLTAGDIVPADCRLP